MNYAKEYKREYESWKGMRERCNNPNHVSYHRYGGRGIKVCYKWKSLKGFIDSMGPRPEGCQLDRINNDGDYTPINCRWVTAKENVRNSTVITKVTAFGETKSITEWAEDKRCNVSHGILSSRLNSGWDPEASIITEHDKILIKKNESGLANLLRAILKTDIPKRWTK